MKKRGEYTLIDKFVFRFGLTFWFILVMVVVTQLAIHDGISRGYYSMKDIMIGNTVFYILMIPFGIFNYSMGKSEEQENIKRYERC